MSIQNSGKVARIVRYTVKGDPGTALDNAFFEQGKGLAGDMYAQGGQRQISLFTAAGRGWMHEQAKVQSGLCFTRFKENLTLEELEMSLLTVGSRLQVGACVLKISEHSKHCHAECALFSCGAVCRLAGESFFATVVQSGHVKTGDIVTLVQQ